MDAQYKADLEQVLGQMQPRSVLCLGAPCASAVQEYVAAAPGRLTRHVAEPSQKLERYDLVIVAGLLERLEKSRGEQLLAWLRDLQGGRFLVLVPIGPRSHQLSQWEGNELLALGLVLAGRYPGAEGECHLYRYDLNNYKTVPDWFNARFWAHPERWDKDFW